MSAILIFVFSLLFSCSHVHQTDEAAILEHQKKIPIKRICDLAPPIFQQPPIAMLVLWEEEF